mgnify:CR=1 FL=1
MILLDEKEGIEIVRFDSDHINALNAGEIKASLMRLFENPRTRVVIDLTGVSYLDSSAFAMFLHLQRISRANYCVFRFCGLSEPVKKLFTTLNLHTYFEICNDSDAGIESIKRGGPG